MPGSYSLLDDARVALVVRIMYAKLGRSDRAGVAKAVSVLMPAMRSAPVDFLKGATEVIGRHGPSASRAVRFYRKLKSVILQRDSMQSLLFSEMVSLELVFLLCHEKLLGDALAHLREVLPTEPCSSNAMLIGYAGIICLELALAYRSEEADVQDQREHIEVLLQDGVSFLHRALTLMPECSSFAVYLARTQHMLFSMGRTTDYPRETLEKFIASNPDHLSGYTALLSWLSDNEHENWRLSLQLLRQLRRLDPTSDVVFSSLSHLYDQKRIEWTELFDMCYQRLSYRRNDRPTWAFLAKLLSSTRVSDCMNSDLQLEKWWIQMHFRHPRKDAIELGLSFDNDFLIEQVSDARDQSEAAFPVDDPFFKILVDKCICAAYLLPPTARFVRDTIYVLDQYGHQGLILQVRKALGRALMEDLLDQCTDDR